MGGALRWSSGGINHHDNGFLMDQYVQLVYFGEVLNGFDPGEVKDHLAQRLSLNERQVSLLFSGQRVVLKNQLAAAEVTRYVTHLENLGARVRIEPLTGISDMESPAVPVDMENNRVLPVAATSTPTPTTVVPNEVTCPKCGQRQPKRTLCIACGVDIPRVLAAQAAILEEEKGRRMVTEANGTTNGTERGPMLHDLPTAESTEALGLAPPSSKISLLQVIGVAFIAGLLAVVILASGWVPLLDSANLAIHEAGHPLVGLLSSRLEVYGGTLFQLAFPLAVTVHFLRQSHATGASVGLVWLGENLHNVARYMADARVQELPLVGGGNHDWTEIFSRWGVLHLETRIANLTHALGWLLMLGAVLWLFLRRVQSVNGEREWPGSN